MQSQAPTVSGRFAPLQPWLTAVAAYLAFALVRWPFEASVIPLALRLAATGAAFALLVLRFLLERREGSAPELLALVIVGVLEALLIHLHLTDAAVVLGWLSLLAIFAAKRFSRPLPTAAALAALFLPSVIATLVARPPAIESFGWLALLLPALAFVLIERREQERLRQSLRSLKSDLEQRSVVDHLTGVLNRTSFEAKAPELLWLCDVRNAPLSLIRFDLDRLKRLNERLGYAAGDMLIQKVSELIRRQLRQGDLVARLGGGDFVALLPGASLDAALRVAERIRRECERLAQSAGCTLSAGVAQRHRDEELAALIARADGALERAKRLGRNRVEVSHLEVVG